MAFFIYIMFFLAAVGSVGSSADVIDYELFFLFYYCITVIQKSINDK